MPLSKGQILALEILARSRTSDSYVAGSTPLNATEPRMSEDIDVFPDSSEAATLAADKDAALLAEAGFENRWIRRMRGVHALIASRDGVDVKLECSSTRPVKL